MESANFTSSRDEKDSPPSCSHLLQENSTNLFTCNSKQSNKTILSYSNNSTSTTLNSSNSTNPDPIQKGIKFSQSEDVVILNYVKNVGKKWS